MDESDSPSIQVTETESRTIVSRGFIISISDQELIGFLRLTEPWRHEVVVAPAGVVLGDHHVLLLHTRVLHAFFEQGGPSGVNNGGQFQAGGFGRGGVNYPQQNFQGHGPGYDAAYGGSGQGQQWYGGEWQDPNYGNAVFSSEFGEFDEGYYDGNHNFGQGIGGFGNNGNQRYHRSWPAGNFGGRGHGGNRSRFVPRGRGRTASGGQPRDSQEKVQNPSQNLPVAVDVDMTRQNVPRQPAQQKPQAVAAAVQQPVVVTQTEGVKASKDQVSEDEVKKQKDAKLAKKLEKVLCFRFIQSGHFAVDCTAELCLYCELATHASKDCPKLKAPKQTAVMYGMANDGLQFFDLPVTEGLRPKPDCGKIGRVRVEGGSMTKKQVIEELKWFVPGDHQWDISPVDEHTFRVVYPTKIYCARVRKIGDIKVEGTPHKIFFEDWSTENVDRWRFSDVWVRFHGCPEELRRDYLALFPLVSLVGKTNEIDMLYTRQHGVVRASIQVTNPKMIPDHTNFSYDGEGYDIVLEVEGEIDQEMEEVDDGDDQNKNEDGHDRKNEDDEKESEKKRDDVIDETAKENVADKNLGISSMPKVANLSIQVGSVVLDACSPMRTSSVKKSLEVAASEPRKSWFEIVEEEERLAAFAPPTTLVGKRPDYAATAGNLRQNSTTAVLLSSDDDAASALDAHWVRHELVKKKNVSASANGRPEAVTTLTPARSSEAETLFTASPCPVAGQEDTQMVISDEGLSLPKQSGAAISLSSPSRAVNSSLMNSPKTPAEGQVSSLAFQTVTPAMSGGLGGVGGTGVFLGGRYSKAELIAFGGIPEPQSVGVRSSHRIRAQPNSDATQLERAQQLADARDIKFSTGTTTSSHFSIASIPTDVVVARAAALGVSLGDSHTKVFSSVHYMKAFDLERTLIMLKKKEDVATQDVHGENSLDLQEAIALSDDLCEEEQRVPESHKGSTTYIVKGPKKQKNKVKENFPVRKSARLSKKK
ncbi:hypothetical protein ACQ4PT_068135 [Festuca glaucescens]